MFWRWCWPLCTPALFPAYLLHTPAYLSRRKDYWWCPMTLQIQVNNFDPLRFPFALGSLSGPPKTSVWSGADNYQSRSPSLATGTWIWSRYGAEKEGRRANVKQVVVRFGGVWQLHHVFVSVFRETAGQEQERRVHFNHLPSIFIMWIAWVLQGGFISSVPSTLLHLLLHRKVTSMWLLSVHFGPLSPIRTGKKWDFMKSKMLLL